MCLVCLFVFVVVVVVIFTNRHLKLGIRCRPSFSHRNMRGNSDEKGDVRAEQPGSLTLQADQRRHRRHRHPLACAPSLSRNQSAVTAADLQRGEKSGPQSSSGPQTLLSFSECCPYYRNRWPSHRLVRLLTLLVAMLLFAGFLAYRLRPAHPFAGMAEAPLAAQRYTQPPSLPLQLTTSTTTTAATNEAAQQQPSAVPRTSSSLPPTLSAEDKHSAAPSPIESKEQATAMMTQAPATVVTATTQKPATSTTTVTTTKKTAVPFRAAPLPASWAQGGGSVRVPRAFSVLTVMSGPPLSSDVIQTAEAAATASAIGVPPSPPLPSSVPVRLLHRAARRLHTSGMTRHDSFHEWLIMHSDVLVGSKAAAAAEEEAAVRSWWAAAQREEIQQQSSVRQTQKEVKNVTDVPRQVRVLGLPYLASANPHAATRAFAFLYGMRLVETEYVIVHGLHRVPISAMPANAPHPSASGPAFHDRRSTLQAWVQREITLALQALSQNDFPKLSHVLIHEARPAASVTAGDAVHAYRLQVSATADRRDVVREAALQAELIAYVKKVLTPAAATTDRPASSTPTETTTTTTTTTATTITEPDELPVAAYGTASHFHCQHAPLYNVRVPVPFWMRGSRHRSTTTIASTGGTSYTSANRDFPPVAPPALSTLCEVLLSSHSGMPANYAPQGTVFHRSFCQAWLQFTLLPSPQAPRSTESPGNPLLSIGKALRRANNANNKNDDDDDATAQQMDMAQSLGDDLCVVEWAAHLKAAQLWYGEQVERQRRPVRTAPPPPIATTTTTQIGEAYANTTAVPSNNAPVRSNMAGPSPYLDQYAALLFSDDAAQLSRLAGTYLAFLPNASRALHYMRRIMEEKLAFISLQYATERTRRFKSRKEQADREVVCLPSHLARVDLQATMYSTQWFLSQLALRCLQHQARCLGGLGETEERVAQNMDRYLSTTGKWSRGEFRVCMSAGVYVDDPSMQLL